MWKKLLPYIPDENLPDFQNALKEFVTLTVNFKVYFIFFLKQPLRLNLETLLKEVYLIRRGMKQWRFMKIKKNGVDTL